MAAGVEAFHINSRTYTSRLVDRVHVSDPLPVFSALPQVQEVGLQW